MRTPLALAATIALACSILPGPGAAAVHPLPPIARPQFPQPAEHRRPGGLGRRDAIARLGVVARSASPRGRHHPAAQCLGCRHHLRVAVH